MMKTYGKGGMDMKEKQDTRWNELGDEGREEALRHYNGGRCVDSIRIMCETFYGKHNLVKK